MWKRGVNWHQVMRQLQDKRSNFSQNATKQQQKTTVYNKARPMWFTFI